MNQLKKKRKNSANMLTIIQNTLVTVYYNHSNHLKTYWELFRTLKQLLINQSSVINTLTTNQKKISNHLATY